MEIKEEIKTRRITGDSMRRKLRQRVRAFEQRYEMSSSQMSDMLKRGNMRETAEIVKWMQAYHVLQFLQGTTHTTGTPGTTTGQSMKDE